MKSEMIRSDYLGLARVPESLRDELNNYIRSRVLEFQSKCDHVYTGSSYGIVLDSVRMLTRYGWEPRFSPVTCVKCWRSAYKDKSLDVYVDEYEIDSAWEAK